MPRSVKLLSEAFYARECLEVALDLLGKHLRHGPVTLRITEVEAYRFPYDSASHCFRGRTPRNAVMWGPPGRAYVYLCYGLHQMFNVVADAEGRGSGVLVRACEPVEGLELVQTRRGGKRGPELLTGPGKVASALGLTTADSGHPLFAPGGVEILDAPRVERFLIGPRVGVDFALPSHRRAPWRLAVRDCAWVSQRRSLRPWTLDAAQFVERERFSAQPKAERRTA